MNREGEKNQTWIIITYMFQGKNLPNKENNITNQPNSKKKSAQIDQI
jgi:hypothetical protein